MAIELVVGNRYKIPHGTITVLSRRLVEDDNGKKLYVNRCKANTGEILFYTDRGMILPTDGKQNHNVTGRDY